MDSDAIAVMLAGCRRGDTAAWDALVDAYWQRLYGYALRATNNSELARDLVQETFLRIVQKLEKYDHQGKFEAWLFRILVNLVRDHGRVTARRPVRSIVSKDGDQTNDITDDLPGKSPIPADILQRDEDVSRMELALGRLSEMDRQVLLLRHYGDMPFKDIARVLNCPMGTVLARAHRAMRKLRLLMEVTNEKS